MKTFRVNNINEIEQDKKERVIALGYFDGVHKAHQKIIKNTVSQAKEQGKIAALVTLDKSPKEYFNKEEVAQITPFKEKHSLLEKLGIAELYLLEFNKELRTLQPEDFIEKVLLQLNATEVFCGYDYRFGYKGEGTPELIECHTSNKILVNKLDKQDISGEKISSTKLREFIENGDFSSYYNYTNRYYKIYGEIIQGRQLGRTINFPTANLHLTENFLLPKQLGVYITIVKVRDSYYKGITNIGNNPTVSTSDQLFIETHILDFDEDIYGEIMDIYFLEFLRPEYKFSGIDELKEQLEKDKKKAESKVFTLKIN